MASALSTSVTSPQRFTIGLSEVLNFAYDAFCSNKLQFTLTALAMAVGTASVILVVTISLTSRDYILEQIRGLGSNMIYAYYETGKFAEALADWDKAFAFGIPRRDALLKRYTEVKGRVGG